MNSTGVRLVPPGSPTNFVRRRWAPYVHQNGGLDRKFYELCALSELKNGLRAGDISVPGSRQFRDFDEYLIGRADFAVQTAEAGTGLSVIADAKAYLEERLGTLRRLVSPGNFTFQ